MPIEAVAAGGVAMLGICGGLVALGLVGMLLTGWLAHRRGKKRGMLDPEGPYFQDLQKAERELRQSNQLRAQLSANVKIAREGKSTAEEYRAKYDKLVTHLRSTSQVRTLAQPVVLLGPRAVGKTSLKLVWYAPWERRMLKATEKHTALSVPVYRKKRAWTGRGSCERQSAGCAESRSSRSRRVAPGRDLRTCVRFPRHRSIRTRPAFPPEGRRGHRPLPSDSPRTSPSTTPRRCPTCRTAPWRSRPDS